eukprot:CAMPEP_0184657710 /NCGR_PEP_ID=MMETSP0308-20130426/21421_1 /TAXON_ID=38269 /ORGANISM="Gloeochaete witrockiana, Strain SAG 46.84" /LENGTH=365 /DNA_ID=CAMNT_0027095893 /DNA_START=1271 /DNA_END=2368 /DNA_ORIENTATION=-
MSGSTASESLLIKVEDIPVPTRDPLAEDSRRFFTLLYDSQHPSDCSSQSVRFMTYQGTSNGMGSELHHLSYALLVAVAMNRTLVPADGRWLFEDPVWCNFTEEAMGSEDFAGAYSCYFLPLSSCTMSHVMDRSQRHHAVDSAVGDERVVRYGTDVWSRQEITKIVNPHEYRPPGFEHKGVLWIRSQVIGYIFRLSPRAQEVVDAKRMELSISPKPPQKMVGIHVRGQDKVSEATLFSLDRYMERALPHMISRGIDTVYLATDTQTAIEDAQTKWSQYKFVIQWGKNRNIYDHAAHVGGAGSGIAQESLASIADAVFLSECEVFVGTFSSNFGRLAYELAVSKQGRGCQECMVVAESIDDKWYNWP